MASIQPRTRTDKKGRQRTRYRVQVRKHGFPPVTATFDRKTDADRWSRNIEADMDALRYFPQDKAKRYTLAQLVDRRLAEVKIDRPRDYDRQDLILGWWKQKLGAYTLATVTPDLIARYRDELQTKHGLSPSTVNRYLAALSMAYTRAVKEWRWLPATANPMLGVSKKPEPEGRLRFLSDDERTALLEACRKSAYQPLYLIVLFALTTGMRRGELFGLRWQDIHLGRRDKEGNLTPVAMLENTKNGDKRSVPIVPEVADLLREHGAVRKLGNDQVFVRDGASETWMFDRAWYQALKDAKIKDFRFHDCRHCAASYAAMSGATVPELAAMLGHRTLQMVKRYAHLTDQHVGEVVGRMTKKFFAA